MTVQEEQETPAKIHETFIPDGAHPMIESPPPIIHPNPLLPVMTESQLKTPPHIWQVKQHLTSFQESKSATSQE